MAPIMDDLSPEELEMILAARKAKILAKEKAEYDLAVEMAEPYEAEIQAEIDSIMGYYNDMNEAIVVECDMLISYHNDWDDAIEAERQRNLRGIMIDTVGENALSLTFYGDMPTEWTRAFGHSGNAKYIIALATWHRTARDIIRKLGIKVKFSEGAYDLYKHYYYRSHYEMILAPNKKGTIKVNLWKHAGENLFYHVDGAERRYGDGSANAKHWNVPLAQGYLLYSELEKISEDWTEEDKSVFITWNEDVLTQVKNDISMRIELDSIALTKLDAEIVYDDDFLRRNNSKITAMKPYQKIASKFIARRKRVINGDAPGVGKTVEDIAALENDPEVKRVIVVCPALAIINWRNHIADYTGHEAFICRGEQPTQWQASEICIDKKHKYIIINYDILGSWVMAKNTDENGISIPEKMFPWVEILNLSFADALILDEVHRIKTPDTQRSQACRKLRIKPNGYVIPTTGTLLVNRPQDAWAPLHMIDPDMFPSYEGFINSYTVNGKQVRNVEAFKRMLKGYMISRRFEEVMPDVAPVEIFGESVEISNADRERYTKAENGIYQEINLHSGQVTNLKDIPGILALLTRLRQITGQAKMKAVLELAQEWSDGHSEDTNNKVLIFCQWTDIVAALSKELGHESLRIIGAETPDIAKRMEIAHQFQTDPKIKYMVCSIDAASEVIDLDKAGCVIFNDIPWTMKAIIQAYSRARRTSNPHNIMVYHVYAKDTFDQDMQDILDYKQKLVGSTVDSLDGSRGDNLLGDVLKKMMERLGRK